MLTDTELKNVICDTGMSVLPKLRELHVGDVKKGVCRLKCQSEIGWKKTSRVPPLHRSHCRGPIHMPGEMGLVHYVRKRIRRHK